MTIESPSEVLNSVEEIQARTIGGTVLVQIWYGGVHVNVFEIVATDEWREVDYWTMTDDRGRAPEKDDVQVQMRMHFGVYEEERL